MDRVRVRFAPSPTGYLHIGGARTALFNWLFARRYDGEFVLRIEDTDVEREKEGSVSQILTSLRWLGLGWDEGPEVEGPHGPYFQSGRLASYQKAAAELVAKGAAYHCFCTPAELEAEREKQRAAKQPFRYARTCRHLSEKEREEKLAVGLKPALRLKIPESGEVVVDDLIHGQVRFDLKQLDDFIIAKSNGMPTYNFACAVDDHAMEISHVLRAEEHLSNTPKQILVYEALGCQPPRFGHLPMILAPDRSKLSKRHGATSVEEFRADGYMPESIINYLTLLGWAPGDEQEFFTLDESRELFSLDKVSKKAAVYDVKKLTWMNGQYLSSLDNKKVVEQAVPFLVEAGLVTADEAKARHDYLAGLIDVVRVRVKTLKELAEAAAPFFRELSGYDEKGAEKYFKPESAARLVACREAIEKAPEFTAAALEDAYTALSEALGLKLADLVHPSRLALTGKTVSPGLFDVMLLLGREKTLARLSSAAAFVEKR